MSVVTKPRKVRVKSVPTPRKPKLGGPLFAGKAAAVRRPRKVVKRKVRGK